MSQSLSSELQPQGVRVFYVFPGLTATNLTSDMSGNKASPEEVAENTLNEIAEGKQYIFPAEKCQSY